MDKIKKLEEENKKMKDALRTIGEWKACATPPGRNGRQVTGFTFHRTVDNIIEEMNIKLFRKKRK